MSGITPTSQMGATNIGQITTGVLSTQANNQIRNRIQQH